jgi:hypothetical protein
MTILTNKLPKTSIFGYGLTTVFIKNCNNQLSKNVKLLRNLLIGKNRLYCDFKEIEWIYFVRMCDKKVIGYLNLFKSACNKSVQSARGKKFFNAINLWLKFSRRLDRF